jgi:TolA-binding protein
MRKNFCSLVLFATLLPIGAAHGQSTIQSQEGITLQNEILQLQNQVQQLQTGGGNNSGSALGNAAPPPSGAGADAESNLLANLLTQVQQLQTEVQTLSGRIDTLQNQVNTQHDATEKEIGDLKFAMGNGAAGATPPGASPATAPGASPATVPAPTAAADPKAELHAAQQAIIAGKYHDAETDARAILATAKTSPQGYQAQFILAQSLYGQGNPQAAAIAFDDTYNRDRTGMYAPMALLGLANSLTSIHQEAAACDTLGSLNSQFPTPPAGLAPRIAAASHRAHCS